MYGWIITKDDLDSGDRVGGAVGVMGPRDISDLDRDRLLAGEGDTFTMYDDDGELYYTGRLVVSGDLTHDEEEACYAPLGDFGAPDSGCTTIRWPGHPHRNCG